ncbi:MAG: hypothetical protein KGH97_00175 [Patescibacteria group bacterium]|nr:hypothetical protein [Patescibacteria group bacterium]
MDVPNICGKVLAGLSQRQRRKASPIDVIDWPALFSLMLDSIETKQVRYLATAHAFVGYHQSPMVLEGVMRSAIGPMWDTVVVSAPPKDVDAHIVNRMWQNTIALSRMQAAAGCPLPHEVTVLLAGGDHVYAETIEAIRTEFGSALRLRLHTFAWRGSLAGILSAASNQVVWLDDHNLFKI